VLKLQRLFSQRVVEAAAEALDQQLVESGEIRCRAQVRSQKQALAWMDDVRDPLPTSHMAVQLLSILLVDPYRLADSGACPYDGCRDKFGADATMHHMVCCNSQHLYGANAVHTAMKRHLQRVLRDSCFVSKVQNEEANIFTRFGLRMDSVLEPGQLSLCRTPALRHKGFAIDTSIAGSTAENNLTGCTNAATVDGYAAAARERAKEDHYAPHLTGRWQLVPFVQESLGRLGARAQAFIVEVATHAAACAGGSSADICRRRAVVAGQIRSSLGVALARAQAERVMAYVRGAERHGRRALPVSSLLLCSTAAAHAPTTPQSD